MKRRSAIQVLAGLGIGSIAIPSCNFKDEILDPNLVQISLNKRQKQFIQSLSDLILPKGDLQIETPEPFSEFVTTMMNDCSAQEDIKKYAIGYQEYKAFLSEQFTTKLNKLSTAEIKEIFAALKNEELITPNAAFFYNKTKNLARQHLTSSKYYMQEIDNYEFIPGRYNGCATL